MRDLRHPISGNRLAPVGWRKNGAPIWPIMGGSQDAGSGAGTQTSGDTNTGGTSGDSGASGGSTDNGSQSGAQSGGDTSSDGKGTQSGAQDDKVDRAEHDAVKARQAAADRRAATAEAELQKIRDKDKSELELAQRDKTTAEQKATDLQSEVAGLKVQIAFLSDNQVQWHDPADALVLLQRDPEEYGLVIEEDGTVKNMKAAIKKLADTKKHLVNTDAGTGSNNGQRSGSNVGGAGAGNRDKNKDDPETLKGKYPALRR